MYLGCAHLRQNRSIETSLLVLWLFVGTAAPAVGDEYEADPMTPRTPESPFDTAARADIANRKGFVWANKPSDNSYTPSTTYAYNSTGGAVTITRSGIGNYAVRFAGLGGSGTPGGHVQATAYGTSSHTAKIRYWNSIGSDFIVHVRCFDSSGAPADSRYTVLVLWPPEAPPSRDIQVAHFEITQGLQRNANDIPLVLGKTTVIRVFPVVADAGTDISGISAELHALRGGAELPGSPIIPDNGPIDVSTSFTREAPDDSLNFTLEPDWYEHDTDFWVEVKLPGTFSDPNPADNRFPVGSGTYAAAYNNRDGLSIRWVKVRYNNSNWTGATMPRPSVGDQHTCDFMRAIYPASETEIEYDPWIPDTMTFTQTTGTNLDASALITELNTMYNAASSPTDRLYGWTPEDSISFNGISDPLWAGGQNNVACGNDTRGATFPLSSRFRRTFAHETGHNTDASGLFHTSRRLMNDEYGFDVMSADPFGRVVMRKYPSGDPNPTLDLFDFMRGGEVEPHAWITPPYYEYLYNWMAPGFAPDAAAAGFASAGNVREFLVCRGDVTRDGKGRFFPFYRIPATPNARRSASNTPSAGNYHVRFLDAQGTVVRDVAWTPDFRADDSEEQLEVRPFTWILPPNDQVTKVELRYGNEQLDSFDVAPTSPRADNLEVATSGVRSAAASGANMVHLSWNTGSAARATTGSLKMTHQVYFTRDDGRTWNLVSTGLPSPTADVDLSKLPGGNRCILRVSTSDGYNATTATTEPFQMADKSPTSTIIAPRSGLSCRRGGGLLLLGRGFDLEDGALADNDMTWLSDSGGELGHGERLVVRNLGIGRHSITLRCRDRAGNESVSAPIVVNIQAR